jgi:dCMP deaminase
VKTEKAVSLMRMVLIIATQSPDPRTQNGAILATPDGEALVSGVNEFPKGVKNTDERWERPNKYFYVEHAERNAIFTALRAGIPTKGNVLVCPWSACADCARAIIQSGISTLIRLPSENHDHWEESCQKADEMFAEAGVTIIELTEPLDEVLPLLRNGQRWTPSNAK